MPVTQVLHGKLDILSSNGLDASPTSPPTPNAIKAFSPESDPVVKYMRQQMQQYVKQMKELAEEMQHALQHLSDELATEIVREQQHLMLMQDQVRSAAHHGPMSSLPLLSRVYRLRSCPCQVCISVHCSSSLYSSCQILRAAQHHSALLRGQSQQRRHWADACAVSQHIRPVTSIICLQVDKHKSDVSREVNEIHRRSEQEKTQRTCMMR